MPKEIQLTQGQSATVCDCHAHLAEGKKWYAEWNLHTKSFYATRHASALERLTGAPEKILMHRVVNNTPKGFQTDHINQNTLDNRCSNLRTATRGENQRNRGKHSNNTSGFKGVSWSKTSQKWHASITSNGKRRHIGYFDSAEQAARAYDETAREMFGEFSRTNF